jgi:putative transposase
MSTLITTAIDEAVTEPVPLVGKKAACNAVGLPRASDYRANPVSVAVAADAEPERARERKPQAQPRALTDVERAKVVEVLHSERFADAAPATVYATLLDEGT